MKLRPLGSTGLLVSPLGLGLAALGRPGYINLGHADDLERHYDPADMEMRAHRVLDAAWAMGVRYFDAARSYGRAEGFLGRWLRARDIALDSVTIGSKWGYTYTANWQVEAEFHEIKEHSLPVLQRQWAESRGNLGLYLRVYQIHSATPDSGVLTNRAVLTELARLKSEGIAIGLSLSGVRQSETLRWAIEITLDGARLFDCAQATWNLLDPSAAPALQEARSAGMGVMIKEALANGRLTSRNREPDFQGKLEVLTQQATRLNATLDALALAAALAQPWADIVLSGATTEEQLLSNRRALEVRWDEAAAAELASLAEPPEVFWETRKRLAWN